MIMEWSTYQQAVFDAVEHTVDNLAVIARAGSGKTTTILEAIKRVPRTRKTRVVLTAFNRSIAEEMQRRLGASGEAKTLHQLGLGILKSAGHARIINDEKGFDIAMRLTNDDKRKAAKVKRAAAYLKNMYVHDATAAVEALDDFDFEPWFNSLEEVIDLALKAMALALSESRSIDFDDMVWLPVRLGLRAEYPPHVVFVDEAQDLNPTQLGLITKCMGDARIVMVADPRQAIYGFRGADEEVFRNILGHLETKELPLSITYRCATSIVDEVRKFVPDLEAAPGAPVGVVRHMDRGEGLNEVREGDFVISRTNRGAVNACLALAHRGIKTNILGRSLGETLQGMIRKSKATNINELSAWVQTWQSKQVAKCEEKDQDPGPFLDRAGCLLGLIREAKEVHEVEKKLRDLFIDNRPEDVALCSTVHRIKGLERDRVFMLRDTFLQPWGKRVPGEVKAPSREEENLYYVACTRAKRELVMLDGEW